MEPKVRKIRKKDWDSIGLFIKNELDHRKKSQYRKDHENIWREVDRQLKMQPMVRLTEQGVEAPPSWNSAFELGELSKASEVITADIMRITFPQERRWFEAHVEIESQLDEDGRKIVDEDLQEAVDGLAVNMMSQQHADFGFRSRFELSVKEALHHGSYVAEVLFEKDMDIMEGSEVKSVGAPVWIPHSMWNCYPDMSPRIIGTNMFYRGSMIIVSYMPLYKLKQMKGEGWMPAQFSKIPKTQRKSYSESKQDSESEIKDVELATYYGDLVIERGDGDIYLPNSKAIIANGVVVFYRPNELPYPSVIFGGYEKQDARDPYYTSPIIKQSPMQKLGSILANKFVDNISLKVEPPIVYDGNDPYMVQRDGPTIAPGVKTPSKSLEMFKSIEVGDPTWALEGLQMVLRQMQEGTGVSSIRTGMTNSDRKTATEVQKTAQGAEVRTVDFIDKLNRNLRTFLYMQHALNVKYLDEYTFYNDDVNSPDFIRISRSDVQKAKIAHFDVVGARGLLGEEQRMEKMSAVTAFASQNPLFAPLLKPAKLLLEAYQDAGIKNPERFVNTDQEEMVPAQQVEQAVQEAVQPLQEEVAKTQEALAKAQMAEQAKVIEAQTKAQAEAVRLQQDEQKIILQHQAEMEKIRLAHEARLLEIGATAELQAKQAASEKERGEKESERVGKSEDMMKEIMRAISNMKPPVVNISQGGKKTITLPGGRQATVENE